MNKYPKRLLDFFILPARIMVDLIRSFSFIGMKIAWKFLPVGSVSYQVLRSIVRRQNYAPARTRHTEKGNKEALFLRLYEPTRIELAWQRQFPLKRSTRFSIYIPVHSGDSAVLDRTIQSLLQQSYGRWTAYFCLDQISKDETVRVTQLLRSSLAVDAYRIVPSFTFDSIHTYCLYMTAGDCLREDCLYQLSKYPDSDLISYDLLKRHGSGHEEVVCRISGNSPELMISNNYLSHAAIKFELIQKLISQQIVSTNECQSDDYAILSAYTIQPSGRHTHICKPLYRQTTGLKTDRFSESNISSIFKNYLNQGIRNPAFDYQENQPHISWPVDGKLVSIIIPTRDKPDLIKTCVESIRQSTDYPNYEIILVDNGSTDPTVIDLYRQWQTDGWVKIVEYNQPFNYSHAINLGVSAAKGMYLLFLNNDIRIFRKDWLNELVQWAMLPQVGMVGAQLWYPDETIQHAGVVIDPNRLISHVFCHQPKHSTSPHGSTDWYRNYVGVTGACQLIRAELFQWIGGYDEKYQLSFSDIEICLKLNAKGYRTVYNPHAQAYHHESATRKDNNPTEDIKRAIVQFSRLIQFTDPFYSPELTDSFNPRIRTFEPLRDRIIRLRLSKRY
jgi:GT2 family glycosyltransferase